MVVTPVIAYCFEIEKQSAEPTMNNAVSHYAQMDNVCTNQYMGFKIRQRQLINNFWH